MTDDFERLVFTDMVKSAQTPLNFMHKSPFNELFHRFLGDIQ
jgi:hypothetical protein